MKELQIEKVQFHVGCQFGKNIKTSVHAKEGGKFTPHPLGIIVELAGDSVLVPIGNIVYVPLLKDAPKAK